MTKKKGTVKKKKTKKPLRERLSLSRQQKVILGSFLFFLGIALFFAFVSFFFNWKIDQSEITQFPDRTSDTKNWLSIYGAKVSNFFIFRGFGISAIILPVLISLLGVNLFFDLNKKKLAGFWFWGILVMLWISVVFGFVQKGSGLLAGVIGYEINDLLQDYIGFIGTVLVLAFLAIVYIVVRLKYTPEKFTSSIKKTQKEITKDYESAKKINQSEKTSSIKEIVKKDPPIKGGLSLGDSKDLSTEKVVEDKTKNDTKSTASTTLNVTNKTTEVSDKIIIKSQDNPEDIAMEVKTVVEEEEVENLSDKLVKDFGEFDPTLELGNFKFPTIELLKDYSAQNGGITIDQGELEENKNKIVETLKNYKIEIAQIKATVGPTVTLYEIVPEAGIRISKIKNLEDDIALSLAALGIRIIAPIPGKGTIGIEVPNKKSTNLWLI